MEDGLERLHGVCKDRNIPISWSLGNPVSSSVPCLISPYGPGKAKSPLWALVPTQVIFGSRSRTSQLELQSVCGFDTGGSCVKWVVGYSDGVVTACLCG